MVFEQSDNPLGAVCQPLEVPVFNFIDKKGLG